MHPTLRRNAAGRAAGSVASMGRLATGAGHHGYRTDFHTAWGIPAVARSKWAITPVDARPTRRGAPPH